MATASDAGRAAVGQWTPTAIGLRIGAALIGGYAFTWGFAALGITGLVALGSDFHEAEMAAMIGSFLVLLAAFLWAFATGSAARAWLVLGGGGAAMTAIAWALQQALLD